LPTKLQKKKAVNQQGKTTFHGTVKQVFLPTFNLLKRNSAKKEV
jgi:hypothetical protein